MFPFGSTVETLLMHTCGNNGSFSRSAQLQHTRKTARITACLKRMRASASASEAAEAASAVATLGALGAMAAFVDVASAAVEVAEGVAAAVAAAETDAMARMRAKTEALPPPILPVFPMRRAMAVLSVPWSMTASEIRSQTNESTKCRGGRETRAVGSKTR
jgi:hypothetical protein